MKSYFQQIGAVLIFLGLTLTLSAGPSPAGDLLHHAYATLERADHDYKGHRHEAMKQIEAAAKLLGVNLHGDGKGHEKQGLSDEQLRAALGMLEQARGEVKGKALHHVDNAIKQIHIALKIK
ncbi:MAG: hypothetical protein C5B50_26580 [Verrucomicrobia bacterium]|nr:MAG: hypothetical protein C5B50_26580 [Verrucomicrobiota bacterium]